MSGEQAMGKNANSCGSEAVTESSVPDWSGIWETHKSGDFLDCYTVPLAHPDVRLAHLAHAVFCRLPGWIQTLLSLRDSLVRPFGLSEAAHLPIDKSCRDRILPGESINFLPVLKSCEREIVMGLNDDHLDFRISLHRPDTPEPRLSLASLVHTNNFLGKAYLRTILQPHRAIVRTQLASVADFDGYPTVRERASAC